MKKSYLTLLLSIGLTIGVNAQKSASAKIKEWTNANKGNITFVSQKEFNSMSPAVKAIFNTTENTLVYKNTITIGDIRDFHAKNKSTEYVRFEQAEINSEKLIEKPKTVQSRNAAKQFNLLSAEEKALIKRNERFNQK